MNASCLLGKSPNPGSSAVSEKVRTRLEELDDLEEVHWCAFNITIDCKTPVPMLDFLCLSGFPEGASEPLSTGLCQPDRGAQPVPEGGLVIRPEGQSPENCHPGKSKSWKHRPVLSLPDWEHWLLLCVPVLQAAVWHVRNPVLPQQVCPHHRYPWYFWWVKFLLASCLSVVVGKLTDNVPL